MGGLTRVLLIEDDEDDYILVNDLLAAGQGVFDLSWAASYEAGLEALNAEDYDVCLVDFRLGERKGSELIRNVLTSVHRQHPPMIMLTGQGGMQSDIEALNAGAADFLEKGRIDSAILERAIRYALERDRTMRALLGRENELRIITNELDDGLLVTDLEDNVLFINPAAEAMLGHSEVRKVPEEFRFALHNGTPEVVLERGNRTLVVDMHHNEAEWRGQQVNILTLHDITSRIRAEEAHKASEERYALAAAGANDGLWDWDLKHNRIYFSPRWLDMAGFTPDAAFDDPEVWFDLVHPEDLNRFKKNINDHLQGLTAHLKYSYRQHHKDGGYRWMLCRGRAVFDKEGNAYRMAGSQTDITRQKESEEQLRHDMMHDSLTGLPNQTLFLDRLRSLFLMHERQPDVTFALIFVDLDDFKIINDSLGHVQGDRLLVKAAHRLKSCIRNGDTVARLGGDEFALILANTSEATGAMRAARRIQSVLDRPFGLEGQEVFISTSIGIALATDEYRRPEELLRDADTAMYRAKSAGKNRYAVFSQDMHQAALKRLQLETELRRAVSEQQLVPFFQPIVEIASGEIAGLEALVRWEHPEQGFISPGDFIPICEETGLIVPLGELVMSKAFQHRSTWHEHIAHCPDIYISLNLSPRQLIHVDLPDRVGLLIEEHALDPENLRLEITETALMENAKQALQILTRFRDMNIKIYLDDFGTGYSSLSYLHTFPIDVLKIDKSFVDELEQDSDKARKIIEAILNLAQTLDMDVIAEGIETASQLEILRALGCPFGQGYYFSRPLNAEKTFALLTGEQS
jgi:diguanylate cyclase (GGDEF)-like protein/PAS domain S-box-containing protein